MRRIPRDWAALALGWLALLVAVVWARPLLPVDETRYAGVAWEMFSRNDWLVPHLNGVPYAQKPPLLFWIMDLGWTLFGATDWWPRLGTALFALGGLWLTRRLALRLWPTLPEVAGLAPLMVLGSQLWAFFTGALMFDLVLAFWVLVAVNGLVEAALNRGWPGWTLMGLGIGLGVLAKGPVVLLHVLPAALLAFAWLPGERRLRDWYLALTAAVGLGAGLVLAWAWPAAIHGGAEYARAIFWGQTAERMVDSFAHRRPLWWYLPTLPLILFPWLLWPAQWRALRGLALHEWPVRLCLAWLVPVFAAFSLVSGKQLHYLLPLFPAFALLSARGVAGLARPVPGRRQWPVALPFLVMGLVVLAAPWLAARHELPPWAAALPAWAGLAMGGLGLLTLFPRRPLPAARRVPVLAGTSLGFVVLVNAALFPPAAPFYDLRAVSRFVADLQARDVPVAFIDGYRQEFHFYGRLTRPLSPVDGEDVAAWVQTHPDGYLVSYGRDGIGPGVQARPVYAQPYRGKGLTVWSARELAAEEARVAGQP